MLISLYWNVIHSLTTLPLLFCSVVECANVTHALSVALSATLIQLFVSEGRGTLLAILPGRAGWCCGIKEVYWRMETVWGPFHRGIFSTLCLWDVDKVSSRGLSPPRLILLHHWPSALCLTYYSCHQALKSQCSLNGGWVGELCCLLWLMLQFHYTRESSSTLLFRPPASLPAIIPLRPSLSTQFLPPPSFPFSVPWWGVCPTNKSKRKKKQQLQSRKVENVTVNGAREMALKRGCGSKNVHLSFQTTRKPSCIAQLQERLYQTRFQKTALRFGKIGVKERKIRKRGHVAAPFWSIVF